MQDLGILYHEHRWSWVSEHRWSWFSEHRWSWVSELRLTDFNYSCGPAFTEQMYNSLIVSDATVGDCLRRKCGWLSQTWLWVTISDSSLGDCLRWYCGLQYLLTEGRCEMMKGIDENRLLWNMTQHTPVSGLDPANIPAVEHTERKYFKNHLIKA